MLTLWPSCEPFAVPLPASGSGSESANSDALRPAGTTLERRDESTCGCSRWKRATFAPEPCGTRALEYILLAFGRSVRAPAGSCPRRNSTMADVIEPLNSYQVFSPVAPRGASMILISTLGSFKAKGYQSAQLCCLSWRTHCSKTGTSSDLSSSFSSSV